MATKLSSYLPSLVVSAMDVSFEITEHGLEERDLKAPFANARAGGFVAFEGWVRNENKGREVVSLEYEAYVPLVEREGLRIMEEAGEQFRILGAHCVHRVGHLPLGGMAVWVGVSSAHRSEAFAACRFIIDQVKERVPIWKKEHYEDGVSGWLRSPG